MDITYQKKQISYMIITGNDLPTAMSYDVAGSEALRINPEVFKFITGLGLPPENDEAIAICKEELTKAGIKF